MSSTVAVRKTVRNLPAARGAHGRLELTELIGGVREGANLLVSDYTGPESIALGCLDETLLKRGVRIRMVFRESLRNDRSAMDHVRLLVGLGVEIRTVPVVPQPLLIGDGRFAVLWSESARLQSGGESVLTDPVAVEWCHGLYEQTWANAAPIGAVAPRDACGLSPQQRELLRLLALGLTDDAVHRRLGVSLRTVRRMVAELMTQLGARSRFQAGKSAADAGWI